VTKAKGERGIPLTVNVPYGYVKDPENPKRWVIDPEAADVVRRIFSMCMEGRGPQQIANQLKADKVLTPTAYKKQQGRKTPHPEPENPYGWGDKLRCQHTGTPGVHRLYRQLQNFQQFHLGQEAA
jgi:hypothetical protein